jgi:hypothetical protein
LRFRVVILTNVSEVPDLCECLSNGNLGALVAEVGGRDLGGEEELVAGELGVEEALSGGGFVAVGDGGVDLVGCGISICSCVVTMVPGIMDLRHRSAG